MHQTIWAGIDCGYSHLTVSLLDDLGETLIICDAREPLGNGHDPSVALARLQAILPQLQKWRTAPITLAGYCYTDAGVRAAFEAAGWRVVDAVALNDVVGVYGLSQMEANVVVAGCGSFSQLIYVDHYHNICWPSDQLVAELPVWPLSGEAYGDFIQRAYPDRTYQLLSESLDQVATQHYLRQAAQTITAIRNAFWHASGLASASPPKVVVGGGAIRHEGLWQWVAQALMEVDCSLERVQGEQAIGLIRYAVRHRTANAWGYIGDRPPSWLDGA